MNKFFAAGLAHVQSCIVHIENGVCGCESEYCTERTITDQLNCPLYQRIIKFSDLVRGTVAPIIIVGK